MADTYYISQNFKLKNKEYENVWFLDTNEFDQAIEELKEKSKETNHRLTLWKVIESSARESDTLSLTRMVGTCSSEGFKFV